MNPNGGIIKDIIIAIDLEIYSLQRAQNYKHDKIL